jgi:hypothetical protein
MIASALIGIISIGVGHGQVMTPPPTNQSLEQQKLKIELQQDNANVTLTRLNTMLLTLENMTGEIQIMNKTNTVSSNGTEVK